MAVEKTPRNVSEADIAALNANIEKQLSFKRNFVLSIVNGVGYAIGAAVVAAVLVAVLNMFIHGIQDIPVIGKVFADPEVQNVLSPSGDNK